MLPAGSLDTLVSLINKLVSAKSPEEAAAMLTSAAIAAGCKVGARKTMAAAVNLRAKVKR